MNCGLLLVVVVEKRKAEVLGKLDALRGCEPSRQDGRGRRMSSLARATHRPLQGSWERRAV